MKATDGVVRWEMGDGVLQGDPAAPLFFSIGIHGAVTKAEAAAQPEVQEDRTSCL